MKPTETTDRLLAAKRALKRLDTDKLFASGIDITVHDYSNEERNHVERVTIGGEDFEPVRIALFDAIQKTIQRRRASLVSQIRAIDEESK